MWSKATERILKPKTDSQRENWCLKESEGPTGAPEGWAGRADASACGCGQHSAKKRMCSSCLLSGFFPMWIPRAARLCTLTSPSDRGHVPRFQCLVPPLGYSSPRLQSHGIPRAGQGSHEEWPSFSSFWLELSQLQVFFPYIFSAFCLFYSLSVSQHEQMNKKWMNK